jgi:hypothetical protein
MAHFVPKPAVVAPVPAPTPDHAPETPVPISEAVAPAVPVLVTVSEEDRVLADLHWLIQDGYVVEFSNGRLWAQADKPPPPPPPAAPAPPAATEAPAGTAAETPSATTTESGVAPTQTPEPAEARVEGGEPNPGAPATS